MQTQAMVRVGALCFIIATAIFVGAQIIVQTHAVGYNFMHDDISVLGTTVCGQVPNGPAGATVYGCSPAHTVMNVGFILVGILTTMGILLTRHLWPKRTLTTIGLVCVLIGSLGTLLVGFFPSNVNLGVHALGAVANFIIGNIGILLLGCAIRSDNKKLAVVFWVLGFLGIAGFFLYGSQHYLGLGIGGMERLFAYAPVVLWTLFGIKLMFSESLKK